MLFDLRLAVRALQRQRATTAAAVLTVGLAVAANTALFSVFDGLLFRPLPFANVDRLVHIAVPTDVRRSLSREALLELTTRMGSTPLLERRFIAQPSLLLEEGAADVQAWGLRPASVSKGWFELFGVVPVVGRLVDPGNDTGFLMGEDLWRTRYGADPSLIGTPVRLPGMIFTNTTVLAGIVPKEFSLPDGANIWFGNGTSVPQYFNFARLAGEASIDQVRAMLPGAVVTPLREHVQPDGAFALAALLSATALVLGWILTPVLTRGVVMLLPDEMTRGQLLSPDLRALGCAAAVSLVGVLILALVPFDVVRRGSPLGLMRGSAVGGGSIGTGRWRTGMLVAQLAVTVVLLYMSGLAVSSASRLAAVDLGFNPDRVLAFRQPPLTTTPISGAAATPEERRAHIARQIQAVSDTYEALRQLPGVVAAAGGRIPFLETRIGGGASVPFDAAWLPAKRASHIQPSVALRHGL